VYHINATQKILNYQLAVDGDVTDWFNYNCDGSAVDEAIEGSVEGFEERAHDGSVSVREFTFGRMKTTGS
jgi:hypothetical protein